MDTTQRSISKIARCAGSFTTRTMRCTGIGASEFDLIYLIRRRPGITQAEVCQRLETDKGATARQLMRFAVTSPNLDHWKVSLWKRYAELAENSVSPPMTMTWLPTTAAAV